jgi:hypothetical protein
VTAVLAAPVIETLNCCPAFTDNESGVGETVITTIGPTAMTAVANFEVSAFAVAFTVTFSVEATLEGAV